MKAGFTISIAVHVLALAILLVTFSAPLPMENQQTEEVPITLVPLNEEMSVKQGEKQASQKVKPSPRPTQKPETKPNAENVGDANIDTKMPVKPKEKPREVKAPPPSQGEEQGRTEPAVEKQPSEPVKEQPKQEQEKPRPPEPQPPKPAEEKPAPKPLPEPAPMDDIGDFLKADAAENIKAEKQEQPKPDRQEKPKPEAPELPQKAPLPAKRPEAEPKKQENMAEPKKPEKPQEKPAAAKGEKDGVKTADSRNALIDRTRTQGGGAKRSEGNAGMGAQKTIGNQDNLQQTLNNIIGSCVARNWDIGVLQGSAVYDLRVQMHFKLNQDGSLAAEPDMTPAGGDFKDREVIVVQARAALKKCAPFRLPADKYSQWHDVTVNMRAFPD